MVRILLLRNDNYPIGPKFGVEFRDDDRSVKELEEFPFGIEQGIMIVDYVDIKDNPFGKMLESLLCIHLDFCEYNDNAFKNNLEKYLGEFLKKVEAVYEKEISMRTLIFRKRDTHKVLKREDFALTGDGRVLMKKEIGSGGIAWVDYTDVDIEILLAPKTWDDVMRFNKDEAEYERKQYERKK